MQIILINMIMSATFIHSKKLQYYQTLTLVSGEAVRVIGIYRDDSRMWGCVGGVAAYTPPHPGTSTAIPNEPAVILANRNELLIRPEVISGKL